MTNIRNFSIPSISLHAHKSELEEDAKIISQSIAGQYLAGTL